MLMDAALGLLRKYYGYSSFRPGQGEVIANAAAGRDTLVLMPTGGGKSLCYQIPALMLPGCAIVVSPLIALMIDQVTALRANGIPAVAIHSNQDERVNREYLYDASQGRVKLIYISPERLMIELENIVASVNVSLIAIDEAHCISQWGHDFRPVYTELSSLKSRLPDVPMMALTATADRLTRQDIAGALGLVDPFAWIGSFDRPNLSIQVFNDPGKAKRVQIISRLIERYHSDSGIVYCLSRKKTEDMHRALEQAGYRSVCYHAGMTPREREMAQRAFVNGDVQVVCATIAFGMGIDKSNIRWVVHNNIPGNIESYYQEIGRAGRDGMPAETILFYNYGDVIMRRQFVDDSGQPEINNEKLDFMQRYAEATVCRRRILLSYFSEESVTDCGNCDNCRNPREKFDGTVLAQKVLSAVIRVNAREGISMIIDILRASYRQDLVQRGYDRLKTYGVGRDLSSRAWHSYILQMIQLGLLEVAYDDNFHLRPTALGMRVVKGQQRIELAVFVDTAFAAKKPGAKGKAGAGYGAKGAGYGAAGGTLFSNDEKLMEVLKRVRKELADREKIAAYMVFHDSALADMVAKRPQDIVAFSQINGAGEKKTARYGEAFVNAIRNFKG